MKNVHPSILTAIRRHLPTIEAAEKAVADEQAKAEKLAERLSEAYGRASEAREALRTAEHPDVALIADGELPDPKAAKQAVEAAERGIIAVLTAQNKHAERIVEASKAVAQARKAAIVAAQEAAGIRLAAALASVAPDLEALVRIRAAFAFPTDERLPEALRAEKVGVSSSLFDRSYQAPERGGATVRFGSLLQLDRDDSWFDGLLAAARAKKTPKAA